MASSSNPQAVKSEAKCLSDAALAELQQLATSHPEAVAFELKYNYNCHVVVSVPHLVAAIARTTGKAFFEVAVYKEQQELWAFISASMQTVLPEKGKKGKSKGLLKPFWPGGVPAPSNVGDHISLPSPAAIVRLGPAQERFGHGTNSLREAVIQVSPACQPRAAFTWGSAALLTFLFWLQDWARGQPFDRVAYDAAKKQLTLQSSKKRKGEPLQSDEVGLPMSATPAEQSRCRQQPCPAGEHRAILPAIC